MALARLAFILALGSLLVGSFLPTVRAGLPFIGDNGNASSTASWSFVSSDHISLSGAHLLNGHAELNWTYQNTSWPSGSDLAANGSLGSNLTANSSGVVLRSDSTNHVVDGTFASAEPWTYSNSTEGNLTASWEPASRDGRINYTSATTEIMWDGLDEDNSTMTANWQASSVGCAQYLKSDAVNPYTPPGMMQVVVSLGSCTSLSVVNVTSAEDWSQVNRFILWVDIPLALHSPSFSLTAVVSAVRYSTPPQPLVAGPQQIVVDLDKLGVSRSGLTAIGLQFNFQSVATPTSFYVDDLRIAEAKVFNQTASISQLVEKANVTSPRPGSAFLSFDWALSNDTGVVGASPVVNLSQGLNSIQLPLLGAARIWNHFSADVSSATSFAGSWNLSYILRVAVNNTEASNATFRVDNVTLFFPNRTNGTYTSNVTSFGSNSEFLQLAWSASNATGTTISLGLRTGNTTNGSGTGWTSWTRWTTPGFYVLSVASNPYYQVRAQLATTNASISPTLISVGIGARHRVVTGFVSAPFTAPTSFLRWDNVSVEWSGPAATSVSLYLGDGTYWTQRSLDANISSYTSRSIAWRVDLGTYDGLQTPLLLGVNLTYEYTGPFQAIVLSPAGPLTVPLGEYVHLTATALDAGGHVNTSAYFTWSTTDPALKVYQNSSVEGTYYAATPGNWTVTALASGTSFHASITINVTGVPNGSSGLPSSDPLLMVFIVIALAAAAGFTIYEVAIRRMFAIDDVFLIAKDGRLIIHNTRRMRADRDEDILSGMLTAIMAFLRDQDPEENGELKRFQVGGKTTLLERGEHVYLSAIYSGRVPGWAGKDLHRFMVDLEDRFGRAFAAWNGSPEDLRDLKEYMQRFVSHVRYRSDPSAHRAEA